MTEVTTPAAITPQKVTRAISWNVLASLVTIVVQLGITMLMARLLTPRDYGLFAVASVVLVLAGHLLQRGLVGALVRRPGLDRQDIASAMVLAFLASGIAVTALLVLANWLAVSSTGPAIQIQAGIVQYLALATGLQVLSAPSLALLQRELAFARIALVQLAAIVLGNGLVAPCLAWSGHGVWSLATGLVVNAATGFVLLVWLTRPGLHVGWYSGPLRKLLRDSFSMTALRILDVSWVQLPFLLLGFLGTPHQTGLYHRAHYIADLAQQMTIWRVSAVLFPALAGQRRGRKGLARYFHVMTALYAMAVLPVAAFVAVTAPSAISLLLGENWLAASPVLSVLALVSGIWTMNHPAGLALEARGWFRARYIGAVLGLVTLVGLSFLLPSFLSPFLPWPPLWNVAIAALLSALVIVATNALLLARIIRFPLATYMAALLPGIVLAAGTALATGLAGQAGGAMHWPPYGTLFIQSVTAALSWLVLLRVLLRLLARFMVGQTVLQFLEIRLPGIDSAIVTNLARLSGLPVARP